MEADTDVFLRRVLAKDELEIVRLMRDSETLHQPWIQSPSSSLLFKLYMQRIHCFGLTQPSLLLRLQEKRILLKPKTLNCMSC